MDFVKKICGFRFSPYQNAGAAWNQSLMLNAIMVQASEVKVLSMGYEVTCNCFFQEQMKALHQATVYESTYKPNVTMFHHVVPQCESHGVCHLETRIPTGTHCPKPVTAKASSITRLLQETSCSFPEKRHEA